MKLSNTRKKILKKNFRSIDLRYFVGCLFADKIPREYSTFYDQLANIEECIYPVQPKDQFFPKSGIVMIGDNVRIAYMKITQQIYNTKPSM